jgi:hypothetical protein
MHATRIAHPATYGSFADAQRWRLEEWHAEGCLDQHPAIADLRQQVSQRAGVPLRGGRRRGLSLRGLSLHGLGLGFGRNAKAQGCRRGGAQKITPVHGAHRFLHF